jgi:phage terminase large subunit GpA-like protein
VGVDVQGNRLAVHLVGWGREQRCWVLDWLEIPGDPTKAEVWEKLDEYLAQPLVNEFGVQMRIAAVGVDARYLKDSVLKYTPAAHRNVFAMQGEHSLSKTILSSATKPDKNRRGRTSKRSVDIWSVNSSAAKEWLFLRLQEDAKRDPPTGWCAFRRRCGEEYYTQLTAEIYDPRKRLWVKQQARNEALDTYCYALAATFHPNVGCTSSRRPTG